MSNKHPFHIVDMSPWPLISSLNIFNMLYLSLTYWKMSITFNLILSIMCLMSILMSSTLWWRDIIRESSYQGHHTTVVFNGLKISMLCFIISETMFFFSFFWSMFHFSLSPDIEISNSWPPINIMMVNPFHIPLLNSIILISSGAFVTWSHFSIINKKYHNALFSMMLTITLGVIFSYLQILEYNNMQFSMNDSVYGSIFYLMTGFHGLHVMIGTLFLMTNIMRMLKSEINNKHHFSLEAAAWYWHFVDVVWIYLYLFLYWWWF